MSTSMTNSMTNSMRSTDPGTGTSGPTVLARIFALDRFTVSASAVALTLGASPIAGLLDWPTWIVLAIGVGFIPYGWMLHTIVRSEAYASSAARASAVGDALWVLASLAVIVLAADATSTAGMWIIAAQALMVADIGLIKVIGWRRS